MGMAGRVSGSEQSGQFVPSCKSFIMVTYALMYG